MADQPTEGRCTRCKQPRPVFPYKPIHNCIRDIGLVSLPEAADHISALDDIDDRWCLAIVDRWCLAIVDRWCLAIVDRRAHRRVMCVPCHDREAADEHHFVDTVLEEDHL